MAHTQKAFQDYYPDQYNYCYGCGKNNKHGLQIKSHWDGDTGVLLFDPKPYHMAFPGYVYGGLIASLIDCHSIGTAAAAVHRANGAENDPDADFPRYVTASLHVDYLKPTPMGQLEVRTKVTEIKGRKVVLDSELFAQGQICARAKVVAVQMPESMMSET